MADLPNREKGRVVVEDGPNGYDLKVNSDGSINVNTSSSSLSLNKQVYSASFDYNLANTGEKLALYLNNPSGSTKIVKLIDLTIGLTNTVSSQAIFRMYVNPTITANGTAVTISPAYIGASQPTATALVYSGPSASANGTQYWAWQINGGPSGGQTMHVDFDGDVLLAANNRILITGNPDGVNRNAIFTLRWAEV